MRFGSCYREMCGCYGRDGIGHVFKLSLKIEHTVGDIPTNTLQWRHNERNGISNHRLLDCVLNRFSGADQRTFQSFVFVRGIHRWPANSPHKEPVARKMFPFDDAIMRYYGTETKPFTPLYHAATERAKFCRQFQMLFLERNFCISISISLEFVPKGPVDENLALAEVVT